MEKQVAAVYEHGTFRPLESVELEEHQHVLLKISEPEGLRERSRPDTEYKERARRMVRTMSRIPSLEEVQKRLSKIPGSLTDDFIAERGEH